MNVLERIVEDVSLRDVPVVVYTARDLDSQEVGRLKRTAKSVVLKDARSPERLLDETALFLHRMHAALPGCVVNMAPLDDVLRIA